MAAVAHTKKKDDKEWTNDESQQVLLAIIRLNDDVMNTNSRGFWKEVIKLSVSTENYTYCGFSR